MGKKIIYLDQNKWIDLVRAINENDPNHQYNDVKDLIIEKSKNNSWIFPLSIIHFLETESRLDNRSRTNLSTEIAKISRNYTILPYIYCEELEIRNLVAKLHNLQQINIKKEVIKKEALNIVGLKSSDLASDKMQFKDYKFIFEYINKEINLFECHMNKQPDIERITQQREDDIDSIEDLEEIKDFLAKYPKEWKYKVFLVESFVNRFGLSLSRIRKELNLKIEDLIPEDNFSSPEKTMKLLEACPSFHVKTKLIESIARDSNRDIQKNDFKDIAFLSMAIPYCDIVITERNWVHHVKANKLDEQYCTIISNSLNDLLNY